MSERKSTPRRTSKRVLVDMAADGLSNVDDSSSDVTDTNRSGRRKIKIEFIHDKPRRNITFSKRKYGIMKKAFELSKLTGTQLLLLVVSESGLVYTYATSKFQNMVSNEMGQELIQACLNSEAAGSEREVAGVEGQFMLHDGVGRHGARHDAAAEFNVRDAGVNQWQENYTISSAPEYELGDTIYSNNNTGEANCSVVGTDLAANLHMQYYPSPVQNQPLPGAILDENDNLGYPYDQLCSGDNFIRRDSAVFSMPQMLAFEFDHARSEVERKV